MKNHYKDLIILLLFVLCLYLGISNNQKASQTKAKYDERIAQLTEERDFFEDQLIQKNTKIAEQTTTLEDAVFKIEELEKELEFVKMENFLPNH